MLHRNDHIIRHKVGLLNLADDLGNVAKASKMMEVSRDAFYRYKEAAAASHQSSSQPGRQDR